MPYREHLNINVSESVLDHVQPLCCCQRQVDDTSIVEVTAIGDAHDNRLVVIAIEDAHNRAKRQRRMACSKAVHVEAFTTGGLAPVKGVTIPTGNSVERVFPLDLDRCGGLHVWDLRSKRGGRRTRNRRHGSESHRPARHAWSSRPLSPQQQPTRLLPQTTSSAGDSSSYCLCLFVSPSLHLTSKASPFSNFRNKTRTTSPAQTPVFMRT